MSAATGPAAWLKGAVFATALRLRIPGKPMPAPRPRMSKNGHSYNPRNYSDWSAIAQKVLQVRGEPLQGPLMVALDVVGERPKKTVLQAPRGDVDNFTKAVLDACTKARAWLDDSQVMALLVRKRWGDPGEEPGVNIWIVPQSA